MQSEFESFKKKRRIRQIMASIILLLILLAGWAFPFLGFFIPFCMVAGLIIALFAGRKWCDWACPRGAFLEGMAGGLSRKKGIPQILRSMPLRLVVLVLLMSAMIFQLFRLWPSAASIGFLFLTLLTITSLAGIIMLLFIAPRAWCTVCPVGTLSGLISRRKMCIDSTQCISCKRCAQVCPMGLNPSSFKGQGSVYFRQMDCLRCSLCVKVCPKGALKL